MDARQRYYSRKEIQEILSVSKTTANQIMHMFEKHGKMFRFGDVMRVEVKAFEDWCRQNTVKR